MEPWSKHGTWYCWWKNHAPLICLKCMFYSRIKTFSGIASGAGFLSINRLFSSCEKTTFDWYIRMAHCVHDNMHTTHTEIEMHTFHANVRFRRHGNISFGIKKGKKTLKMKWQLVFFRLLKVVERRTKKRRRPGEDPKTRKRREVEQRTRRERVPRRPRKEKPLPLLLLCLWVPVTALSRPVAPRALPPAQMRLGCWVFG